MHFQPFSLSQFLHKWPPKRLNLNIILTVCRSDLSRPHYEPRWVEDFFFENAEGVRFLRSELQTALESWLLAHIRGNFTAGIVVIYIWEILVRFWKSTWIFAWYLSTFGIRHPAYQKNQNCVGSPKIAFLDPNNLAKRKKTSFPKIKIRCLTEYRGPLILK